MKRRRTKKQIRKLFDQNGIVALTRFLYMLEKINKTKKKDQKQKKNCLKK